jgi:hypothetical protein
MFKDYEEFKEFSKYYYKDLVDNFIILYQTTCDIAEFKKFLIYLIQ